MQTNEFSFVHFLRWMKTVTSVSFLSWPTLSLHLGSPELGVKHDRWDPGCRCCQWLVWMVWLVQIWIPWWLVFHTYPFWGIKESRYETFWTFTLKSCDLLTFLHLGRWQILATLYTGTIWNSYHVEVLHHHLLVSLTAWESIVLQTS